MDTLMENCELHIWRDVLKESFPIGIEFEVDGLYDLDENCIIQTVYYSESMGDVICWGDPLIWRYKCDCIKEKQCYILK